MEGEELVFEGLCIKGIAFVAAYPLPAPDETVEKGLGFGLCG